MINTVENKDLHLNLEVKSFNVFSNYISIDYSDIITINSNIDCIEKIVKIESDKMLIIKHIQKVFHLFNNISDNTHIQILDSNGNIIRLKVKEFVNLQENKNIEIKYSNFEIECTELVVNFNNKHKVLFENNVTINYDELIITIKNDSIIIQSDNPKEHFVFFNLFISIYEYMMLWTGYFIPINNINYYNEQKLIISTDNNLSQKYINSSAIIKDSIIGYINDRMLNSSIINNFINMRNEISLQFDMLLLSMNTNYYSQVCLVNILQSLDGLFDYKKLIYNIQLKDIKKKNKSNFKPIEDAFKVLDNNKSNELNSSKINGKRSHLYKLNFIKKIDILLSDFKDILGVDENLNNRLLKTRNAFSHASQKDKENLILDGVESRYYLYKFILVYRLILIKQLDLYDKIDIDRLNLYINEINDWGIKNL